MAVIVGLYVQLASGQAGHAACRAQNARIMPVQHHALGVPLRPRACDCSKLHRLPALCTCGGPASSSVMPLAQLELQQLWRVDTDPTATVFLGMVVDTMSARNQHGKLGLFVNKLVEVKA